MKIEEPEGLSGGAVAVIVTVSILVVIIVVLVLVISGIVYLKKKRAVRVIKVSPAKNEKT